MGIAVPDVVYTNAAKYYFAAHYHDTVRAVQDIAGGLAGHYSERIVRTPRIRMKMRSLRGFLAAIVSLSALPIAVPYQLLSGTGFETIFHLLFAVGFALISFSVFDFRLPRWLTWIGCLSTGTLGAIFLLQGTSEVIRNDSLTYLAYQVLGQWLERGLLDLLIFWFVALLLVDSQGKTRTFGFVVLSIVVCLEVYTYSLAYLGCAPAQVLKLPYLLMFVWFLFESRRKEMSPQVPFRSGFESKESSL